MRCPFPPWFVAAALSAILVPSLVAAQTAREPFVAGPLLSLVAERLELTAAQKQEARAILGARRPEIDPAAEGLISARKALFVAIHAERPDEAAVREASGVVAERELELALVRARLVQELRAVLTPAQRAELAALRTQGEGLVDSLLARARVRWRHFLAG